MKDHCHAPRCIGRLEGERIFSSPRIRSERYLVWEKFIAPTKRKVIFLCSKHFERKYLSFCNGEVVRLLGSACAIPTIHCQGPDMDVVNTLGSAPSSPCCDIQHPHKQADTPRVAPKNSKGLKSDKTVGCLNEAVRLNPKVDSEDDFSEDLHNATENMEKCESLPEMPQLNTPGILRHSQSLPDVPQSNIRINKSAQDPSHIIEELSEMYSLITLPYLERGNLNLQWVYRILSGEEGCERIVYESPNKDDKDGFLLIKDSKWDGSNLDKLHLIAIAYRPGIMSLRDLGMEHIRLLQNIYSGGKDVIMKKYGVVGTQLRVFLQYLPSFYHIHVSFTAMNDDICGPDFGTAHTLHSVIQNIQMFPSYYQVVTLTICMKESDQLFQEFESRGIVERVLPSS